MGHIKKFHEFYHAASSEMNEETDSDLLRDLEDIGMNEKTYTKEMLKDAMDGVDFAEYLTLEAGDDFNFDLDQSFGSNATVKAFFQGGISGTWDTSSLWSEIESEVSSLNIRDYEDDDDRYTLEELESAFDSVNWEREAGTAEDNAFDDVEVEVSTSTQDNEVEIEAEASVNNDYVTDYIDQDDIIKDILDNL
jgi:hypothetical protein